MTRKLLAVRIDEDLLKKLKFAALEHDLTLQELLARAVTAYLSALEKQRTKRQR